MPVCPHCHTNRPIKGFSQHLPTCKKHPGEAWLRREYAKGRFVSDMASERGVSDNTMRRWIMECGITLRGNRQPRGKYQNYSVKPPVVVLKETVQVKAPVGGCANCDRWSVCAGRNPVLCEALLDWEYVAAFVAWFRMLRRYAIAA